AGEELREADGRRSQQGKRRAPDAREEQEHHAAERPRSERQGAEGPAVEAVRRRLRSRVHERDAAGSSQGRERIQDGVEERQGRGRESLRRENAPDPRRSPEARAGGREGRRNERSQEVVVASGEGPASAGSSPSIFLPSGLSRARFRLHETFSGPFPSGNLVVIRIDVDVLAHSLNLRNAATPPKPARSDASSMKRMPADVCRAFTMRSSAVFSSAVLSVALSASVPCCVPASRTSGRAEITSSST